jgi:hypothetical protein
MHCHLTQTLSCAIQYAVKRRYQTNLMSRRPTHTWVKSGVFRGRRRVRYQRLRFLSHATVIYSHRLFQEKNGSTIQSCKTRCHPLPNHLRFAASIFYWHTARQRIRRRRKRGSIPSTGKTIFPFIAFKSDLWSSRSPTQGAPENICSLGRGGRGVGLAN